jgi:hypothetical protein
MSISSLFLAEYDIFKTWAQNFLNRIISESNKVFFSRYYSKFFNTYLKGTYVYNSHIKNM